MRHFLVYAIYRLLGALTGPLPPRVGYGLARRVGSLVYNLSPQLTLTLKHNMRHVLGPDADEAEVEAVVRKACVNIAKGHYDLFRLNRLSSEQIRQMTDIQGFEHVRDALAHKKGVIIVTAHYGNVDIMAQVPAVYGVPMMGPVEHVSPERLFQYTLRLRQSHGLRLIPADGPLMEMYRALRRGEIVGLPCDRGKADNTQEIEFFGAPARLADGPMRVALHTGSPVVPAFAYRLPDDTFVARIFPPLELPNTGDREADVTSGMRMVVQILEEVIAQSPEQWLVAVPVWPLDGSGPATRDGS